MVCPLCGAPATETLLDYLVCSNCREILEPGELVTRATHETWAAYLLSGNTDTTPEEQPIYKQQS